MNLQSKIALVGFMISIGGLINFLSIDKTICGRITTINHSQGLSANLATALLVIFASKFGMLVSTPQVSVGSLFGIGLINRHANYKMIGSILLSWLLSLPCTALFAVGVYGLDNI